MSQTLADLKLKLSAGFYLGRGATPMHAAARVGDLEAISRLASRLLNITDDDGRTPLWVAARNGHTEAVKLLARLGADHSRPNNHNVTPLLIAAYYGHKEIVAYLAINLRMPINTGLNVAALTGQTEILRLLAALGANPGTPGGDGQTPLARATEQRHDEAATLLQSLTNNLATPLCIACAMGDKIATLRLMRAMAHDALEEAHQSLSTGPYWPCIKNTFMECYPQAKLPGLVFLAASKIGLWGLPARSAPLPEGESPATEQTSSQAPSQQCLLQ